MWPSNCTNMELKLRKRNLAENRVGASNCTNMELKLVMPLMYISLTAAASNCTNMELKFMELTFGSNPLSCF